MTPRAQAIADRALELMAELSGLVRELQAEQADQGAELETIAQAAAAMKVSTWTVRRLIKERKLLVEQHGERACRVVVKSREDYQRRARAGAKPHRSLAVIASG